MTEQRQAAVIARMTDDRGLVSLRVCRSSCSFTDRRLAIGARQAVTRPSGTDSALVTDRKEHSCQTANDALVEDEQIAEARRRSLNLAFRSATDKVVGPWPWPPPGQDAVRRVANAATSLAGSQPRACGLTNRPQPRAWRARGGRRDRARSGEPLRGPFESALQRSSPLLHLGDAEYGVREAAAPATAAKPARELVAVTSSSVRSAATVGILDHAEMPAGDVLDQRDLDRLRPIDGPRHERRNRRPPGQSGTIAGPSRPRSTRTLA